jgi:hypothetical protein
MSRRKPYALLWSLTKECILFVVVCLKWFKNRKVQQKQGLAKAGKLSFKEVFK